MPKKSLKTRQKIIGREIRNIASSQSHGHEIFHRNFSISELREAVGHISCAKSPRSDNFHPEFLKHLGCNALSVLLTLYNHSWKYGVPAIWKNAIVVPIPKKNKPLDDLNSYRPISLTSIFSKVMERMITSRL
ncbi:RNA-directed DNA polymerase from mobile element jockey [Trichonephila clavipes]|nr:RNA-directed DNA polymerase from mobile element jockey [Trichonephila clavipes]